MKEETRRESVAMLKRLVYIGLTKRNTVSTSFLFTLVSIEVSLLKALNF